MHPNNQDAIVKLTEKFSVTAVIISKQNILSRVSDKSYPQAHFSSIFKSKPQFFFVS